MARIDGAGHSFRRASARPEPRLHRGRFANARARYRREHSHLLKAPTQKKGGATEPVRSDSRTAPEKEVRPKRAYGGPRPHAAEKRIAARSEAPEGTPPELAEFGGGSDGKGEKVHGNRRAKYERPPRTGREAGMVTIFLNVGRKHLVTPADIVGKVAGVTRLPATVVGAIDIHQRHTLADVAEDQAELIVKKLTGIRIKGEVLAPAIGNEDHFAQ